MKKLFLGIIISKKEEYARIGMRKSDRGPEEVFNRMERGKLHQGIILPICSRIHLFSTIDSLVPLPIFLLWVVACNKLSLNSQ